jgi:hypothetical protein
MLEDFQSYSNAKLNFRPRINCQRLGIQPIGYTAKEIEAIVVSGWGSVHYCESLRPTTKVKPFFDWDLYVPDEPSPERKRAYLEDAKRQLVGALELDSDENIAIATSHGDVPARDGNTYKLSIRFYVQGYAIRATDLAAFVAARPGLTKSATAGWDNSVYPVRSERLLRVVGAIKGSGDTRVLEPADHLRPYHHYLVQCLIGNELGLPTFEGRLPKRPRVDPRDALVRHSWVPSENDMEYIGLSLMRASNMTTGYRVDLPQLNVLKFVTTGERPCVFGPVHHSNSCGVVFERSGDVNYICHGTECRGKKHRLGSWRTTLAQLAAPDAITDKQMREFDPAVPKAMEDACLLEGRGKLEDCAGFAVYREAALSYFNRFFNHVHCSRPEIVQVRTCTASDPPPPQSPAQPAQQRLRSRRIRTPRTFAARGRGEKRFRIRHALRIRRTTSCPCLIANFVPRAEVLRRRRQHRVVRAPRRARDRRGRQARRRHLQHLDELARPRQVPRLRVPPGPGRGRQDARDLQPLHGRHAVPQHDRPRPHAQRAGRHQAAAGPRHGGLLLGRPAALRLHDQLGRRHPPEPWRQEQLRAGCHRRARWVF